MIISATFARVHFGDRDPVGSRISFQYPGRYVEVAGVVEDVKNKGLDQAGQFQIYAPFSQRPTQRLTVVVRTRAEPVAVAGAMRGIVRDMDPALALSELRRLDDTVHESVWRPHLLVQVFWACRLFAVVLAAVAGAGAPEQLARRATKRPSTVRPAAGNTPTRKADVPDCRVPIRLPILSGSGPGGPHFSWASRVRCGADGRTS